MRIVAGKYRSRVLKSLRGLSLRPTSDRLRETLFNVLGPAVEDSVFVDAYAGTGAVGIEALSRGAREVIFIEREPPAANLIRGNLHSLGVESGPASAGITPVQRVEVLVEDVLDGLATLEERQRHAHFIFLDPPYAPEEEYFRIFEFLDRSPLLLPGGRIILEHRKGLELPDCLEQLELARLLEQGDSALSFYRLALAA